MLLRVGSAFHQRWVYIFAILQSLKAAWLIGFFWVVFLYSIVTISFFLHLPMNSSSVRAFILSWSYSFSGEKGKYQRMRSSTGLYIKDSRKGFETSGSGLSDFFDITSQCGQWSLVHWNALIVWAWAPAFLVLWCWLIDMIDQFEHCHDVNLLTSMGIINHILYQNLLIRDASVPSVPRCKSETLSEEEKVVVGLWPKFEKIWE